MHLIRAANQFVSYGDRKAVSASLRDIYTAPTEEAAAEGLHDLEGSALDQKYPAAVKTWQELIPFLEFPPALRKVIYTTNAIESLNCQLGKVTKTRSHFPSDEAVVKLLWLAICDIEDNRTLQRVKDQANKAKREGRTFRSTGGSRLVEGAGTCGWKQALQHLVLNFPDRMDPYLV